MQHQNNEARAAWAAHALRAGQNCIARVESLGGEEALPAERRTAYRQLRGLVAHAENQLSQAGIDPNGDLGFFWMPFVTIVAAATVFTLLRVITGSGRVLERSADKLEPKIVAAGESILTAAEWATWVVVGTAAALFVVPSWRKILSGSRARVA